jgi:hypothetical protein
VKGSTDANGDYDARALSGFIYDRSVACRSA